MPDDVGHEWTFSTFKTYYDQRLSDLSLQLQQRFEAQQLSVSAALAAADKAVATALISAEKAVNAALIAAEKAVDKAEQAQALRNEAQNEFRKSLSDLSGLMWTTKEGSAALDALRREITLKVESNDDRVTALREERVIATDALRREVYSKIEVIDQHVGTLRTQAEGTKGKSTGVNNAIVMFIAVAALLLSAVSTASTVLVFMHGSASVVAPVEPR